MSLEEASALWQLELGDYEAALSTYASGVHPGSSWGPPINALTDAASFLWRAELAGRPRDAERWLQVSEYGTQNFRKTGLAFADVHRALAYAATGDSAALAKLVAELRERDRRASSWPGPSYPRSRRRSRRARARIGKPRQD